MNMSKWTGPNFRNRLMRYRAGDIEQRVLAAHPKIAADVPSVRGSESIDVIVQFTAPVQQRHLDKVAAHGGSYKATLSSIRGGAFSIPVRELEGLADDPEVAFISIDQQGAGALSGKYSGKP